MELSWAHPVLFTEMFSHVHLPVIDFVFLLWEVAKDYYKVSHSHIDPYGYIEDVIPISEIKEGK